MALLALGSVGRDTGRLDEHSDLDFFVITKDKGALLHDSSWLGPVRWFHQDTPDGCKALVGECFVEYAIFAPDELPGIRFEPGRLVWARADFDPACLEPRQPPARDGQWLTREILSNLYVGLHQWLRGERLAAMRMVQGEALDNLLRLQGADDPFNPARRAESRELDLSVMAGGYEATPMAARAILEALGPQYDAMAREVETLIVRAEDGSGN